MLEGFHLHRNVLNTTRITGTILSSLKCTGLDCLWTCPSKLFPHRKHDLGQGSLCWSAPAPRASLSAVRAQVAATFYLDQFEQKLKFVPCNISAVDTWATWMKAGSARLLLLWSPPQLCRCAYPKAAEQLALALKFLKTHFDGEIPPVQRVPADKHMSTLQTNNPSLFQRPAHMGGFVFRPPLPPPLPMKEQGLLSAQPGVLARVETELKELEKFCYKNQHSIIPCPLCDTFPWVAMASLFSAGWRWAHPVNI